VAQTPDRRGQTARAVRAEVVPGAHLIPCLHDHPAGSLGDPDGARVPEGLPPVVDAHVHLFDDETFGRIWAWFERHAWPIRYRLPSPAVIAFLRERGVARILGLCYSHRPGLSRGMNRYMAALQAEHPGFVHGLATVLPGEDDAPAILAEAFAAGLHGVKLHCHVQMFSPDEPRMAEIYEACIAADRPIIVHAGREPRSEAYKVDPHTLCAVERTEAVLRDFPRLKLVVPHLGVDEYAGYLALLERFDTLWLDTTMVLAGYFPYPPPVEMLTRRPDRVMYGSDFPNLPYAWDRELRQIARSALPDDALAALLGGNATALFGLA